MDPKHMKILGVIIVVATIISGSALIVVGKKYVEYVEWVPYPSKGEISLPAMTKEKPLEPLGKQMMATGLIIILAGVVTGSVIYFGSGLANTKDLQEGRPSHR